VSTPVIALDHASQIFATKRGPVPAVDDVTLELQQGEIVSLVGESGCGKTTTGKMVAGLLKPTAGTLFYRGEPVRTDDRAAYQAFRRGVQLIHQDPYASLNPIHTLYQTLSAPLVDHHLVHGRNQAMARVRELLRLVDLTPPDDFVFKYPHQLSGGQRQRASIARALTVDPKVIVADEAVSMVDVSMRLSLLHTLLRLRDELGITFLSITHDLALARYFSRGGRIGVMYLGRMVEMAPADDLVDDPKHPYTQILLSAIPEPDPDRTRKKDELQLRSAEIPSLTQIPSGCPFHPRCPAFVAGTCDVIRPDLVPIERQHYAACHVAVRIAGVAAVATREAVAQEQAV
jgi:oligopeptide/dipeptide ABC transporter ATP-binding protein